MTTLYDYFNGLWADAEQVDGEHAKITVNVHIFTHAKLLADLAVLEAAVPELLTALEKLIAADNCNYNVATMRSEGYFDAARAAVAKAKGAAQQ